MQARSVRLLTRLGLTAAAALILTGCPEDAADIIEVKATSLDFAVAPVAGIAFPGGSGSVERQLLVAFDTTVSDAFSRGTDEFPAYNGTDSYIFGAPMTSDQDDRAPTLTHSGNVTSTANGLAIFAPVGGPFVNDDDDPADHWWVIISGALQGLPASTTYTLAFVRYGLDVNAELDQAAILLGEPVTERDSLVVLNPNEQGDETFVIGDETTPSNSDTLPAGPFTDANPWVLGQGTTDASGNADFGFVLPAINAANDTVYEYDPDAETPTTGMTPVGHNNDTNFDLPQYNYLVVFEGVGTGGDPLVRWQLAQDLDLSGNPINNAHWPLPQSAFTDPQLIAAEGGAGRPDSIVVELFNLEELQGGGVWQAWVVNRDRSPPTVAPAVADYERVAIVQEVDPITGEILSERDSVLETTTTSSFVGQSEVTLGQVREGELPQAEVKHRLTLTDNTATAGSEPGLFTDVVVTIEDGSGATSPSNRRVLWVQTSDQNETPDNFFDDTALGGSLNFGNFVPADPATSRVFSAADLTQTSGVGGVADVRDGTGIVGVDMRSVPLPPIGFYYEGWLVGPNGNAVSMGPLTTLPPDTTSLFEMDIDQSLPSVTQTGIRFANVRMDIDLLDIVTADSTVLLNGFTLTLEPKLGQPGVAKALTDLQIGTLPIPTILQRRASPE